MRRLFPLLFLLLLPLLARAQAVPPSPSPHYITDQAHVLSAGVVQELDDQLNQYERDTSNQFVVAIYPFMGPECGQDIAPRARAIFNAWGLGKKGGNNGILLIVFVADHRLNITVGDGFHGTLSDATCKAIIDHDIAPRFKAGDYDGGIRNGVSSVMLAAGGQYRRPSWFASATAFKWYIGLGIAFILFCYVLQGMFETQYAEGRAPGWAVAFIAIAVVLTFLLSLIPSRRSRHYGGYGSRNDSWGGGGGGGGFSGGGGSSSGGGASGSW